MLWPRCRGDAVSKTVLARIFRQRQPYLKTCVAGFRIDLNVAAVFLHNSLHRVEAESGSLADALGRKERFEDVGPNLGRNSWTVVADFDYNATVLAIGSNSKL